MGDMDDGFNATEVEFVTLYHAGHSDGYTHSHSGVLFETADAADFAAKKQHGNHAVEAKPRYCIRLLKTRQVYIIDGPYKSIKEVEMEDEIRKSALAKLTAVEKRVLGVEEKP